MEKGGVFLSLFVALLALGTAKDGDHLRKKRDIMQDQPRLVTDNGNLILQCGNTKNIYLRPSAGGGVYIGNDNLTRIAELTKTNKDEIDRLKATTETPANIENRLNSLETTMNTLQGVPTQLNTLQSSFSTVKTTVEQTNANARLLSVESRLSNLQPTGQVQTSLNSLDSRLTTLETRVTGDENSLSGDDDDGDDDDNNNNNRRGGGGRGGGGGGGRRGGGGGGGGQRVTWRNFRNLRRRVG